MKIVVATGNKNKAREMHEMLDGSDYEIVTMKEDGIDLDIIEDGETFKDNALIKARALHSEYKRIYKDNISKIPMVIADDSGLCIDALDGKPGVYSARFLGEDTPYEEKFKYILDKMKGLKGIERRAAFHCVIALIYPDGTEVLREGIFEGEIAEEIKGLNGFGYDPILYVPELGKTTAQISPQEKNKISHRGKAIAAICEVLKENIK